MFIRWHVWHVHMRVHACVFAYAWFPFPQVAQGPLGDVRQRLDHTEQVVAKLEKDLQQSAKTIKQLETTISIQVPPPLAPLSSLVPFPSPPFVERTKTAYQCSPPG